MKRKRKSWNAQLVSIYHKGIAAYERGEKITDCPYLTGERGHGISSPGGNLQKQRARYWKEGFLLAAARAFVK